MSGEHFIRCRVSAGLKERLQRQAAREGLCESALVKHVIDRALGADDEGGTGDVLRQSEVPPERICFRIYPDDVLALRLVAKRRGMPPATYVAVQLRAHLKRLPPMPEPERVAFRAAIAELSAVGRNLNQAVRALKAGQGSGPARGDLIAVIKACEALKGRMKELLLANQRSWEDGHVAADD